MRWMQQTLRVAKLNSRLGATLTTLTQSTRFFPFFIFLKAALSKCSTFFICYFKSRNDYHDDIKR